MTKQEFHKLLEQSKVILDGATGSNLKNIFGQEVIFSMRLLFQEIVLNWRNMDWKTELGR